MAKTCVKKRFQIFTTMLFLVSLVCYSIRSQRANQALFTRACSYFANFRQHVKVCFDDYMPILKKLKSDSVADCIQKCFVATSMNLRGVNYLTSVQSCSCVPKMNVLLNVTPQLTGGCLAFVTHDCPPEFDYVVENNKCYNYQQPQNTWNISRDICNSLLNAHPVVIDDPYENSALLSYFKEKWFSYSWTAGLRMFANGTWFFGWEPYPDIYLNIKSEFVSVI
ncbi:hypothetical protein HELRODRAFT_178516 [Helobdella robusta]|uniref:C-type lectin domain-containing protein n=1 Tax=Helobdella robusta TaxID=6412 RepID=T1FDA5_HELRO|nr:hypothetical protein HELRODRAFT_178516 [Helobdella robusta]ESN97067.1 hypothetical protein HELRODRAFT_178516 [Helobdella robusta]